MAVADPLPMATPHTFGTNMAYGKPQGYAIVNSHQPKSQEGQIGSGAIQKNVEKRKKKSGGSGNGKNSQSSQSPQFSFGNGSMISNPGFQLGKFQHIPLMDSQKVAGVLLFPSTSPLPEAALQRTTNQTKFFPVSHQRSSSDIARLASESAMLRKCAGYHPDITQPEAHRRLESSAVGTFIIRNSSCSQSLVSLSVKTPKGPTSIRIKERDGQFHLDSLAVDLAEMRKFSHIVTLIEHYVTASRNPGHGLCPLFLDPETGVRNTPFTLLRPYETKVVSLQQLCCRAIHKSDQLQTNPNRLTFMLNPKSEQCLRDNPNFI